MKTNLKKILFADQSPSFIEKATYMLRKAGFSRIISAEDGNELLSLLKIYTPDIVMLSARLNGIDGLETLKAIKSKRETAAIPIIMVVSGANGAKQARQSKKLGCKTVIEKPLRIRTITAAVQQALNLAGKNRRRFPRVQFRKKIEVFHMGVGTTLRCENLSEGGAFVATSRPIPMGTVLDMVMPVGKSNLHLKGKVIFHLGFDKESAQSPLKGMSIRFMHTPEDARKILRQHIASLLKGV